MGHLQQQATVVDADGKEVAREGEHWDVAVETLDYVKRVVEHRVKKKHKDYEFALSSKEWAKKVMEKFWEEWFENYVRPVETDATSKLLKKKMRLTWEQIQFWYGSAPTKWLKILRNIQSKGLACGFYLSERDVKSKYLECALPATPIFNGVSLPESTHRGKKVLPCHGLLELTHTARN